MHHHATHFRPPSHVSARLDTRRVNRDRFYPADADAALEVHRVARVVERQHAHHLLAYLTGLFSES